ncbi:MAG: aspartate--ammonia ligase [Bacteroidales bacterium]|jgi:aspartate--ammonia ligase|nr:aspartate--ammonia ligase [Bacteroidales bacterium]
MNTNLIVPKNYNPLLPLKETEQAIKLIKDTFEFQLTSELNLRRVTAPLIVLKGTGINDDLNGVERKVEFPVKSFNDAHAEVVNSLAKWKRMALAQYGINESYGILTDMNALRPDEDLDNIHSIYVDQWDWERVISKEERTVSFLKKIVTKIYEAIKRTEFVLQEYYPLYNPILPEEISFIHAEELLQLYPNMTAKEREYEYAKKHHAYFLIGIGAPLSNGEKHDNRAPDYDDWLTPNSDGFVGLNGDIILWNDVLGQAFEISSMGIRVDKNSLLKQLTFEQAEDRKELLFHSQLIEEKLPLSIGGGIGQSRLCMYLLRKAHIGEVQCSLWPEEMRAECEKNKIFLV